MEFQGLFADYLLRYQEEAYLFSQLLAHPGNTDIQYAAWDIFDPNQGFGTAAALVWETLAKQSVGTLNYSGFEIFSPTRHLRTGTNQVIGPRTGFSVAIWHRDGSVIGGSQTQTDEVVLRILSSGPV